MLPLSGSRASRVAKVTASPQNLQWRRPARRSPISPRLMRYCSRSSSWTAWRRSRFCTPEKISHIGVQQRRRVGPDENLPRRPRTARHGVRSHSVPVALVGECFHPGRVEGRPPTLLIVAGQLKVVALTSHTHGDVADATPGVKPTAQRLNLYHGDADLG